MSPVTTIVISDPDVLAKLSAATGQIVFQGPTGNLVKTVETVPFGTIPPGVKSPMSDEEFEEARKQPDGSPLSEVWKRIHERYGA